MLSTAESPRRGPTTGEKTQGLHHQGERVQAHNLARPFQRRRRPGVAPGQLVLCFYQPTYEEHQLTIDIV